MQDSEIQNFLPYLYTTNPDVVILSAMDVLVEKVHSLPTPQDTDRLAFLFTFYNSYLSALSFTEPEIPQETSFITGGNPIRFTIRDRNRTEQKLRATIDTMSAKDASKFLGQLIRAWLLNAPKEYL